MTPTNDLQPLFESLRRFRSAWMARGWSWDRRFDCAASTFDVGERDEAHRLVAQLFTQRWTEPTLDQAPPLVMEVSHATGGVRADQQLFATEGDHVIAYGLWWPWGGESTNISMRVGLAGDTDPADVAMLQDIFGAHAH